MSARTPVQLSTVLLNGCIDLPKNGQRRRWRAALKWLLALSLRVLAERIDEDCLSAVRQAGSIDPVRRCVVETERKTAAERRRATRGTRWEGGVRKDANRREYPETSRVGDCPGR